MQPQRIISGNRAAINHKLQELGYVRAGRNAWTKPDEGMAYVRRVKSFHGIPVKNHFSVGLFTWEQLQLS